MEVTESSYLYTNETPTDVTSPMISQAFSVQSIIQISFLGVVSVVIVASNTLILTVLHRVPNCFDEMQHFLFSVLAVTDLLTGVFCCLLTTLVMVLGVRLPLSSGLCATRGATCTGLTNLSALLITSACFDRFIAIIYPLRYPSLVTLKRVKLGLLVLCGVAIFNGGLSTLRGRTVAKNNMCLADFSSERLAFRPSLVTSLLILSITLFLTVFFNVKVMLVILGQSNRVAAIMTSNIPEGKATQEVSVIRRKKLRGIRPLIVASVSFFIAILPWNIVAASQFDSATNIATPMARYVTSALLLCNSWMNAWIFVFFNRRFRAAAKRVVFLTQEGESNADTTFNPVMSTH